MAAAPNKELTENIKEMFLQCKICLDKLKSPKTLPCLHTFCADCLHYYIQHNRLDHRKFACPICRRHIYIPKDGVDGFPDSFFVHNLCEIVEQNDEQNEQTPQTENCGICKFKDESKEPIVFCVDCKISLCVTCSEAHRSAKITDSHTLLPVDQGAPLRENFCRVHRSEVIRFYCETCNSCICMPCSFLDHQGHDLEDLKTVQDSFINEMAQLVQQSKDNILQLEEARVDLGELENELFARKEIIKSDIRHAAQDLIRGIQDQESRLLAEVEEFYNTPSIRRDMQKLDRTANRLQRAHNFGKQLLAPETSPVAQIVNRSEAKDNFNQALQYELPDMTHHALKLHQYAHFLPGRSSASLGSVLQCKGPTPRQAVSQFRSVIPSVKAMYMDHLKPPGGSSIGDVLSMAFLPSGQLVLLLTTANKLHIYSQTGKFVREFGNDSELPRPSDLVVTRDGCIAVTDCDLHAVIIFDQFGTKITSFGDESMFDVPISIAIDSLGKFLVCNQVKQTISVHQRTGDLVTTLNIQQVQIPHYIHCFDNKIYICDCENNEVVIYAYSKEELNFVTKLGSPDTTTGHFLDATSIGMTHQGDLLVTDSLQDKIYMFNERGESCVIKTCGKQILQPTCITVTLDGIIAVMSQIMTLDPDIQSTNQVCLFRLIRADI